MTLCIPEAIGVPGLNGQPPTWPGLANGHTAWPAASPSQSTPLGLDDPRWQAHLAIGYPAIEPAPASCCGGSAPVSSTFGTATSEDALFRVLYDQAGADRSLYLSWWVKADDSVDHSNDELYVGFERQAGDPLVIRVNPFASNAAKLSEPAAAFTVWTTPAAGADAGSVDNWTENGGAVPSWLDVDTRVWLDVASNRWAVQMRVPIGAGDVDTHLDLADTFRMWFEIAIELPDGLLAPYSWPREACVVDACGLPSVLHVPPPANWDEFHLRSGASDPACPTTGFVKLSVSDVGTQSSPTSRINLISDNVFEAKPENLTGGIVNPGEVDAEFRIANWGSVADPAAPWTLIPATGGTTNPASSSGSIADGTKGSITMRWQLNPAERADYGPGGTKSSHQCILVTLSGAHVFNPASVWRNMDFVSASTFVRAATISNVGLGPSPVPGTPRPTYILVEKLNMPPVVEADGRPADDAAILRSRDGATATANDSVAALAKAATSVTDPEIRLELQPTIRYHVFHDTGLDVTRGGRTLRVVRPGTAFGYYVSHDGDLDGWRDELRGATEVTANFYRVDVPEEGAVTVTTVIEAVESGGGTGCVDVVRMIREIVRRYVRLARRLIDRLRSLLPGL
jgi:hypothetical protein